MKQLGLAIGLACGFFAFAAGAQEADESVYVPRAERDSSAVLTFKGSGKGLVIINHETGEITRYTTKRQKAIHRMSPDAEESAREAWESRKQATEEYEEQIAKETEEAAEEAEKSDDSGEAATVSDSDSEPSDANDSENDSDEEE